MADYEKQHFVDGQVLTAECLNKIEEGVRKACLTCPDLTTEGIAADAAVVGARFKTIESTLSKFVDVSEVGK